MAKKKKLLPGERVECQYGKMEPVDKLTPNENNPNIHSEDQVAKLAKLIELHGWRLPIVVSNRSGFIVQGHGRLLAAKELGLKAVPVDFQDFKNEAEETAVLISDNVIAELSQFDGLRMAELINELDVFNVDLEAFTGLDEQEILDFIHGPTDMPDGLTDDDAVPDDVETICQPGDLWQLGDHRLLCGDSTRAEDVERLMDGEKAEICFASPPYNAGNLNIKGQEETQEKYKTFDDNQTEDEWLSFISASYEAVRVYASDVFYNIGLVEDNKRAIIRFLAAYAYNFKDIIYWNKDTAAPHIQPGVINNKVEFILCFGDGRRKFDNAQFSQGTYWNVIEGPNASGNEFSKIHKATFPVYLPENIVSNFTVPLAIVVDNFLGTGSTLIACEKTNRKCYGIEIDPHYCDVIIKRWEDYTGKQAVQLNDLGEKTE